MKKSSKATKATKTAKRLKVQYVPLEQVHPSGRNPFKEDGATFNELLYAIEQTDGIIDPIDVAPDGKGGYEIVHGEHRWRAARARGDKEIPVIVHDDWDEDQRFFHNMRANLIAGKLDKNEFLEQLKRLKGEYPRGVIWKLLGFSEKDKYEAIVGRVKKALPNEMRKDLENRRKEVQTIDGLSDVLYKIFNEHGSTVNKSYLFFSYGGKVHYMIVMDKPLKKIMDGLAKECQKDDRDMNEVLIERLSR